MAINSATQSSAIPGAPAAAPRKTASSLGVNDFLLLMSSQLKNQDPLKPLDSTEFVAQLAQFGTVSGVQGMQQSLGSLATALRSSQVLSGATLVGHQVLTAADTAAYAGSGTISGSVDVPEGATQVQLQISDDTGQVLRRVAVDSAAGTQSFQWDGRTDKGEAAAAGRYKLQVIAAGNGSNVSLQPYLMGRVHSVTLDADGINLTVNTRELGSVALGSVREII